MVFTFELDTELSSVTSTGDALLLRTSIEVSRLASLHEIRLLDCMVSKSSCMKDHKVTISDLLYWVSQ